MTQEQREALKGAIGIWSMELVHGRCKQGVVHYALYECEPALCGAMMVDDIWEKTFELLLPAVRHSSSNTCPECAAKAEELAAAALEALTAPGHEEALADLAAENERLRGLNDDLQKAVEHKAIEGECACGVCVFAVTVIDDYYSCTDGAPHEPTRVLDRTYREGTPLTDDQAMGWVYKSTEFELDENEYGATICMGCGSVLLPTGCALPHPWWHCEGEGQLAEAGETTYVEKLQAKNERLRAGMRVLAQKRLVDTGEICPPDCEISRDERFCVCEHLPADCWLKWALAEADARKAGDA